MAMEEITPNPLHDGYRYNGEDAVTTVADYDINRPCEGTTHRYDVYEDGSIAKMCRCGIKPRKVMA